MKNYEVLPNGSGKIAVYGLPEQTWVSKALKDNKDNRATLEALAKKLNK